MNRVTLVGRLTADPELKYTTNGTAVCTFRLAVDRNKDEADFFPIVVWEKQAEAVANYLAKGRQVGVDGKLQTRNYEAQDGTRRYVTEVVAQQVEFMSRPPAEEEKTVADRVPW